MHGSATVGWLTTGLAVYTFFSLYLCAYSVFIQSSNDLFIIQDTFPCYNFSRFAFFFYYYYILRFFFFFIRAKENGTLNSGYIAFRMLLLLLLCCCWFWWREKKSFFFSLNKSNACCLDALLPRCGVSASNREKTSLNFSWTAFFFFSRRVPLSFSFTMQNNVKVNVSSMLITID